MKKYADSKRRAKVSRIAIGDTVLIRQAKHKFTTRYDPRAFKVYQNERFNDTAYRDGKYITRNISQCKRVTETDIESDSGTDSDIEETRQMKTANQM